MIEKLENKQKKLSRKREKNKEVIGISLLLVGLVFVFFSIFKINFLEVVKAGVSHNTQGWSWGGTDDGAGNVTGLGWISMNNLDVIGSTIDYGVNIPADGGILSGYAWSSNLGWISFNAGDVVGCPSGVCSARRNGDFLEGWARFLSIRDAGGNSGGWQGFISLKGSNYGLDLTKMNGDPDTPTYAWSNELGWIDFGRADVVMEPPDVELKVDGKNGTTITLNPKEALPQDVTLSWTVANNASSCVASCDESDCDVWTGDKDLVSGSETVSVESIITNYKLTCTNSNGSGEGIISVVVGCEEHTCGSGSSCGENFKMANNYTSCIQECTTNNDCVVPGATNWVETTN